MEISFFKKILITVSVIVGGFFFYSSYSSHLMDDEGEMIENEIQQIDNTSESKSAKSNSFIEPVEIGKKAQLAAKEKLLTSLNVEDQRKLKIVQEILISENDNDPRIHTEFNNLSLKLKMSLFDQYQALAPEKRKQKALIVLLISRQIQSIEDIELLKKVFEDEPCLSLSNCKTKSNERDFYNVAIEEMIINYPQMILLYEISKQMSSEDSPLIDPKLRSEIRPLLAAAIQNGTPAVRSKAHELLAKFFPQ